jgi:hypothetical protein
VYYISTTLTGTFLCPADDDSHAAVSAHPPGGGASTGQHELQDGRKDACHGNHGADDEASHPADNLSFRLGQITLILGAEQFNISLQ